jgi:Amt family ammonium transporter
MPNTTELEMQINSLQLAVDEITYGIDEMWHLVAGTFVFFMQAGFAMLEAGSVRRKNTINILFKNIADGCISGIFYYLLGFGFAYGDTAGGFIGTNKFALANSAYDIGDGTDQLDYHTFFFQWTFAAATVTIASGCMAERCKLEAYFIYSIILVTFIYPVVCHWCWGEGWLSPFASETKDYLLYGADDGSNGYIDFAGSGIVHMVGGFMGLCGAIVLGPRKDRFHADGAVNEFKPHSIPLTVLGGFILWFGWYGFNPGSTLCMVGGCAKLAARVATATTLSAAASGCTMIMVCAYWGKYDILLIVNSVLAGLVGITGPCAVVDMWAALLIGIVSCFIFMGSATLLLRLQIDDPIDAFAVHGACGLWGALSIGIFGTDKNAAFAGYAGSSNGGHPFGDGEQFGVQFIGALAIIAWTVVTGSITFLGIKYTIGLRVRASVEEDGLDVYEHGAEAYSIMSIEKFVPFSDVQEKASTIN